jgi:hypothetical protein
MVPVAVVGERQQLIQVTLVMVVQAEIGVAAVQIAPQ